VINVINISQITGVLTVEIWYTYCLKDTLVRHNITVGVNADICEWLYLYKLVEWIITLIVEIPLALPILLIKYLMIFNSLISRYQVPIEISIGL